MSSKKSDPPVVVQLRTTESVRSELKRLAEQEQRSMNWIADRAIRRGLGLLKEAA